MIKNGNFRTSGKQNQQVDETDGNITPLQAVAQRMQQIYRSNSKKEYNTVSKIDALQLPDIHFPKKRRSESNPHNTDQATTMSKTLLTNEAGQNAAGKRKRV